MILASVGPLLALARLAKIPASILLFGVGAASTFAPAFPQENIEPELVLTLFLPPLLYASIVRVSWHLLRFNWLTGIVLGSLLMATSIALVAVAARTFFLPGIGWSAALIVGIGAAFFDTRLFHEAKGRPRVPRAIADALKAREITARVILLATLSCIETGLASGRIETVDVLESYAFDIPAGAVLGFIVGHGAIWARRRIDPAPVEIAVSIATPYAAALAAEALGISLVSAVITAALVVSAVRVDPHSGATFSSTEARVSSTAFWEELNLMVSSVLFLLAGRAVPGALAALEAWPLWRVAAAGAGLLATTLAVQFCFSLASTRIGLVAEELRQRKASAGAAAAVMTWSSTRSVIALLIALSLPTTLADGEPFAERDLLLAVTALVVILSILLQGLTLKRVVDWAALADEEEDQREEERARSAMLEAARAPGAEHATPHDAARQSLLKLRQRNEIGDEVLVKMVRETDLHARASEENALPEAGPPNP